jgi:hypothetical protein
MLAHEPLALRVLPGGLGPWPLEPQLVDPANAAKVEDSSSSSSSSSSTAAEASSGAGSSSNDAGVPSQPAATAAAAAAAAHDKVLLLRCLLVYHLQASLLYDAKVGISQFSQSSTASCYLCLWCLVSVLTAKAALCIDMYSNVYLTFHTATFLCWEGTEPQCLLSTP